MTHCPIFKHCISVISVMQSMRDRWAVLHQLKLETRARGTDGSGAVGGFGDVRRGWNAGSPRIGGRGFGPSPRKRAGGRPGGNMKKRGRPARFGQGAVAGSASADPIDINAPSTGDASGNALYPQEDHDGGAMLQDKELGGAGDMDHDVEDAPGTSSVEANAN